MGTYAALLRGINLAGRNKISMAELKALLVSLGFEDVVTYVQSGNVVFRSRAGKADDVSATIERAIATELGVNAAVMLRTPAQLRKVAVGNPFVDDESDPTRLLVVFLDRSADRTAQAQLDPERSPPDRFAVRGREIYLHVPNGFGRSKLTVDYFERRLGRKGTARNWKTVTKLVALLDEPPRVGAT